MKKINENLFKGFGFCFSPETPKKRERGKKRGKEEGGGEGEEREGKENKKKSGRDRINMNCRFLVLHRNEQKQQKPLKTLILSIFS